jgi:hypothetical protein
MPQAAYCAQCGENVYVTDEGKCPNGHGPEHLSGYYDAPEPARPDRGPVEDAAPSAVPGTPAPTATKGGSKLPLILAIVAIVLLLCCCVSVVVGTWVFDQDEEAYTENPLTEDEMAAVEELEESLESEYGDVRDDAERMVTYFYPEFRAHEMAEAGGSGDAVDYHIVAESEQVPGFYITFFATRSPDLAAEGSDNPEIAYVDDEAGVVWLNPSTLASGLSVFAGPDAIVTGSMREQIMADFVDTHGEVLVVTEHLFISNVELGFRGIGEEDLDAWFEDFNTWESLWDSDLANGVWVESSFEYLE